MRRIALSLAVSITLLPTSAGATGTFDDVEIVQSFSARFDLDGPPRQIRVNGSVSGSAAAFAVAPEPPAASHDLRFDGCVQLRRGATLAIVDEACGEWRMLADPTLTVGIFAGSLPGEDGSTVTAAVTFVGTGQPNEPAPIVAPPPNATVQATLLRPATATGYVASDAGEGMSEGELGQDDAAFMSQIVTAGSLVLAP